MSRIKELTRFVSKEKKGIEIGPWCNPLVPKRSGYNSLVLDVFDTHTLRQRAIQDSGLSVDMASEIEDVDLVGSSTEIAELVRAREEIGTFDYILSSHNFEHIPDPIKFLRGAKEVLKPGGILTMAIPDKRGCFDYYRPVSTLAEMLTAYFEQRTRPTQTQIFERWSLHARHVLGQGKEAISFPIMTNPVEIIPFHDFLDAFQNWQTFVANSDEIYRDTHCWVFTPASFKLILSDLLYLGLSDLCVLDLAPLGDSEFCVHLEKSEDPVVLSRCRSLAGSSAERMKLLRCVNDELSIQSSSVYRKKCFLRDLSSKKLFLDFCRIWNNLVLGKWS